MIKCTKAEVRRLKTALRWKIPPAQRERIQMVLLRESGMTQPAIAQGGVSLSAVSAALSPAAQEPRGETASALDCGLAATKPAPHGVGAMLLGSRSAECRPFYC